MSWTAVLVLAAGAYSFKALGLVFGDRLVGIERLGSVLGLLPPALLAALVVIETFDGGGMIELDARIVGVAAGSIAAWRKAPFLVVIVIAAAVTALLRLAG